MAENSWEIRQGDALELLQQMPDESVHCAVTSPPYWGLRDYGVGGQLGLERTPEEYVANLVAVFAEVKRVLRSDGTFWLNLGDSYNGSGHKELQVNSPKQITNRGGQSQRGTTVASLKPKDLVGIPWRVAFALQADGWWLRSDIIWSKTNPMPESVTDRPTKAHEYIFLLTKAARYYYDAEAVKEASVDPEGTANRYASPFNLGEKETGGGGRPNGAHNTPGMKTWAGSRNRRTVWAIATEPYRGAHFATFPTKLVEPYILAGTSARGCCSKCGAGWVRVVERTDIVDASAKGSRFDLGKTGINGDGRVQVGERYVKQVIGWHPGCTCDAGEPVPAVVFDPFAGSGTVGVVALRHGRSFVGLELNPAYCEMARQRVVADRQATSW